jgi:hypothetical protein
MYSRKLGCQGQASDRSLTPTSDEFQVVLHLRCKSGGNQDIFSGKKQGLVQEQVIM